MYICSQAQSACSWNTDSFFSNWLREHPTRFVDLGILRMLAKLSQQNCKGVPLDPITPRPRLEIHVVGFPQGLMQDIGSHTKHVGIGIGVAAPRWKSCALVDVLEDAKSRPLPRRPLP
jgi:hypothetical protein